MEFHFEASKGEEPSRQWCLVYETDTFQVIHVHENIAMSSDAALTRDQLAEAALAQVPSKISRERLAVAHPDPGVELDPAMTYMVDPESAQVTATRIADTFYERE